LLGDNNTEYGSVVDALGVAVVPGYGLFLFHSDYAVLSGNNTLRGTTTPPAPDVENTILLIQDDTEVDIFDSVGSFY